MITLNEPNICGISTLLAEDRDMATIKSVGSVTKLVGLTIESCGPVVSIGDLVSIESARSESGRTIAEVVGFRDGRVLLIPLERISGICNGDRVVRCDDGLTIGVGDALIGRVVDTYGCAVDGAGPLSCDRQWTARRSAPESMERRRIKDVFVTGVNAIDGLLTCGSGQRIGIFSGSGVGKSTLLGMICRNSSSDINVIALIGERGKEVLEFVEDSLGEGLKKSIVVVATSDKPPLQRIKGAETAMAIAEYFRDQGKNVLFLMDSVTRFAMAQREIGLAVGEPAATKGYPPSVYSLLPGLLERAGTGKIGSITAFCTVLAEADDMNDPIADTVRGILDGHIVLSRELASHGHFPAIDILHSISRVMNNVTSKEHQALARELRNLIAVYAKTEDMINIGAYKRGSNGDIDRAIDKKKEIDSFLIQDCDERLTWENTINKMKEFIDR